MYSDEYVDNNNEVTRVETAPSGNNNIKLIICGILALIIIILIIVLLKGKGGSNSSNASYIVKIIPEEAVTLSVGSSYNLTSSVSDNSGNIVSGASTRWSVDNSSVATVDEGTIKGINYGKAIITAIYVADNGKTFQATKEITVSEGDSTVPLTDISVFSGDLQLPVNDSYQISVGLTPSNGFVSSRVFTSSNENVATVDDTGLVNAIGEGEATIYVDVNNGSFKKSVKVVVKSDIDSPSIANYPTSIVIDNLVTTIKVGETINLKYSVSPENASTDKLTWSSSDNNIIDVDNRGNITGISEGTATITLSSENNVSSKIDIIVGKGDIQITSIDYITPDITIIVNQPQTITPTITPPDATDKTLSYSILDNTLVTMNVSADTQSVELTGLRAGTTKLTITATNGVTKDFNVIVENASGGGNCASCKNVTCGAGKYCYCGQCKPCPAGNYCLGGSKIACPAGKGSIANSSSYQDCSACAKGYYSTGNGKGCIACPVGKTTKGTGSTSKNDCSVDESSTCKSGEYFNGTKCVSCPKGYTNYGGATNISMCQMTIGSGQYIKSAGATSTTACSAGTYSTAKIVSYGNTSSCTPCAKGYYQDKTGQGSCNKCPDGTTTSGTGSKNSGACNVPVATAKPTATAKPKATSSPSPTPVGACKAVQYKSGGVCKDCEAGYMCNGSTTSKCPAGTISKARSTRCDKCSSGKSNDARTSCL